MNNHAYKQAKRPELVLTFTLLLGLLTLGSWASTARAEDSASPSLAPTPTSTAEKRQPSERPLSALTSSTIITGSTAQDLAFAMGVNPSDLVSANLNGSDPRGVGIGTAPLGGFPTQGTTFAILSTGWAQDADKPNTEGNLSTVLNGLKTSQGTDLVQLALEVRVPQDKNCLNVDFKFLSEEFPESVSLFDDTFIAELGGTNFTISGNNVIAPLNFAFDTQHNVISVNTVFGVTPNTGTTYDGATPLLRAEVPVTSSATIDVVFSIMDMGNSVYDSAVFLDRFFWTTQSPCGSGTQGGTISGTVYVDSVAPANVVAGAFVQMCRGTSCYTTLTNASGQYSVSGLANGNYDATAYPPAGSTLLPAHLGPITLSGGASLTGQNLVFMGPMQLPGGTTITTNYIAPGGVPVVNWHGNLALVTHGCAGGTASYQVLQGSTVIRSGPMTEGPPGTYSATIPEFYPSHGDAHVVTTIHCPDGSTTTIPFDIYIDPSGIVKTTSGAPIAGATMTLFYSDSSSGPFAQVANGSARMSPMNRNNPDTTDVAGLFGWDVLAGFYKVRAEKTGCVSPSNPAQTFVETSVLEIPPPITNLELVLHCGAWEINLPLIAK